MPLVSIVIPTRNRQNCAATLVKKILSTVSDCEVIVSDNSDDENLRHMLSDQFKDSRLIYTYYPSLLSVVDNFNLGLEASLGDFVTFVGDDDLIGPYFEKIVKWAKSNEIDLLQSNYKGRTLQYFWPGVKQKNWSDIGGSLFLSDFSGKVKELNVKSAMKDALFNLGCGPKRMPRAYLGLISRRVLIKVENSYGKLFGGFSPDVYSSQILSSIGAKAFGLDYPIIIPGVCSLSTSAARAERRDVGKLDNPEGLVANDHIGRFSTVVWDGRVPSYYSPYTVWAQTHLKALDKTHTPLTSISFAHLYATCLIFTPKHFKDVWLSIKADRNILSIIYFVSLTGLMMNFVIGKYVLNKTRLFVHRKPGGAKYQISGLVNSSVATDAISSWLSEQRVKPEAISK